MKARRSAIGVLVVFLAGCHNPLVSPKVWVDVDRLTPLARPARVQPPAPQPPRGLPAKTASLPDLPSSRLVAEAALDGAELAREVDRAQAASLAALRKQLTEVYGREAERFARSQMRLLGDPTRAALDRLYPAYRKAFEEYAERRVGPASRLAFIVGSRDPNPDDIPTPPESLSPLGRLLARRASEARRELKKLDRDFDAVVADLLANVDASGRLARTETLSLITANRKALNDRLLRETTLPLGPRGEAAIRLTLARRGVAVMPAVPGKSLSLPAVLPPEPAPRVDSPAALADARARLLGEVRVWAAQQGARLDPKGKDATAEFLKWKSMRAGASPNSPSFSAAP